MDGCRSGWVIAYVRISPQLKPIDLTFRLVAGLHQLPARPDVRRLFVDMPMGLSEGQTRTVERHARALLPTDRKSSVFPVPCRQAVYAGSYEECCAVNERHLGVRVPRQSFNIAVKIRELDETLSQRKRWRARVFESHPEICFLRFAGEALPPKRGRLGIHRRRELICACVRDAAITLDAILESTRRCDLRVDDLLDAAVLALSAALPAGKLEQLPTIKQVDSRGIPMRLVIPSTRLTGVA